jgi:hypothetical protein
VRGLGMLVDLGALGPDEVESLGDVTRALESGSDDAPAVARRVHDRFVLDGSTATAAALAGLASRLASERTPATAARLWGRTVIGAVTGAHVGRATGAVAAGAVAGAAAGRSAADKQPTTSEEEIVLLIESELGLSPSDAQALADALQRGGAAGMALALMIADAITEADAGGRPAPIEVGPTEQALIASALGTAPSQLPPDLARLRALLDVLASNRHP